MSVSLGSGGVFAFGLLLVIFGGVRVGEVYCFRFRPPILVGATFEFACCYVAHVLMSQVEVFGNDLVLETFVDKISDGCAFCLELVFEPCYGW